MNKIHRFMAFVMDLCCSQVKEDKETILMIKEKINIYLDNFLQE